MSLTDLTIADLQQGLQDKNFTSHEVTAAYLKRIEEVDQVLNSYILVTAEQALEMATAADARLAKGEQLSPLDGIPVALKDNFCTKGITTTCASKMLHNFVPPYSATSWQKLEDGGAVLLGKTNLDEFAMGFSSETSYFGITRNPFDTEYVPGGSSGGSAAAVAADLAAFAMASDTGGSVRQPAHFCGVVGIKPTYGRISRAGIVPTASSLDHTGIIAKSVYDAAGVLEIVAGLDAADSTSASVPVGAYRQACKRPVKGLKIGLPVEFLECGVETTTLAEIKRAVALLREQGAIVEEVSLPHTKYSMPAYFILSSAEISSNLARFDGVCYGLRVEADTLHEMFVNTRTEGFGDAVKRRILLGTYALSATNYEAYYHKALQVRTLIKQDYDNIFADGFDCLLAPVATGRALKIADPTIDIQAAYRMNICTAPINMAGLPGITVPFAQHDGLPLGLQLIAKPFGEEVLFTAAMALEQPRMLPPDIIKQAQKKGVQAND